jgi:spore coat polysaccharide biosynthesis protein SpsF (cytidylyltransferase family)
MKIFVLIQARSSSKRLPFKSLLSLDNFISTELLYKRIKSKNYKSIILTSKDKSDNYFCYLLKEKKIPFHRGDLNNVQKRFLTFKNKINNDDIIIRLTADNIFIDRILVKKAIIELRKNNKKYLFISNKFSDLPYGISVEAFKFGHLKEMKSDKKKDKEHVTYSFDKTINNSIYLNSIDKNWKNLNCSIDDLNTFNKVKKTFAKFNNPTSIRWDQLCLKYKNINNNYKNFKFEKLKLISKRSKDLKTAEILKICKLKRQEWKYNLNSQLKHFYKNFNRNDICNMIFSGTTLIGYTVLRYKKDKNKLFLLLDTFIIHRSFRKNNLGEILMMLNNNEIISSKLPCVLQCKNNLKLFYKKYNWKKYSENGLNYKGKNFFYYQMIFNNKK